MDLELEVLELPLLDKLDTADIERLLESLSTV